jgi:diguanylate cyclase
VYLTDLSNMSSLVHSIMPSPARHVLIVDDNPAIHEDIKKTLRLRQEDPLAGIEADLFGDSIPRPTIPRSSIEYELESAFQGEQALTMVTEALQAGHPFSMAFVDVRMPPGWDGIETIERMRKVDPRIQIVICSAYSDYSWKSIHERLQATDWLMILRKPFEQAEIQQIASALTEKWRLNIQASLNIDALEGLVKHHAHEVENANVELEKRNSSLGKMNERLTQEVHARQLADERIRHIAFHDVLTDLPNRAYLMERLEACIDRSKRQNCYQFAVLFVDVDNFKLVNDCLGHRAGDQLLSRIASEMLNAMRSMQASIRPSHDTVARFGGDEFIILLDDIRDADNALKVAQRIQQAVCVPLNVGQRELLPSISIGVAVSKNDYDDAVDVLRDADTALYHAKAEGKGRIALFDHAMRSRVLERAGIENDLQLAIAKREFVVYYQPIVSLVTGKISCFEALVRWEHPTRGLLPPDCFIPVAEQNGMIEAIGNQVLEQVTCQLAGWRARSAYSSSFSASVNLSAGQIVDRKILDQIDRCLEENSLDPSAVKIELTETTAMHNFDLSKSVIDSLRTRGIEVYLDDFGTGYSSLSTLHTLPFAAIKLDKSFITHIASDVESQMTVRAILMIAQSRNIQLIAEGIESIEQLAALRRLDCEFGQGFFFARPAPPSAIDSLIERESSYPIINDGASLGVGVS